MTMFHPQNTAANYAKIIMSKSMRAEGLRGQRETTHTCARTHTVIVRPHTRCVSTQWLTTCGAVCKAKHQIHTHGTFIRNVCMYSRMHTTSAGAATCVQISKISGKSPVIATWSSTFCISPTNTHNQKCFIAPSGHLGVKWCEKNACQLMCSFCLKKKKPFAHGEMLRIRCSWSVASFI